MGTKISGYQIILENGVYMSAGTFNVTIKSYKDSDWCKFRGMSRDKEPRIKST